jgi:catechol 2,3-dioxygenase-like lactoylglutathione lyase family enzyme
MLMNRIACSLLLSIAISALAGCAASPASKPPAQAVPAVAEAPRASVLFPAINVLDLDASEAFYVDMLGMKVSLRLGEEGDEHREVTLNFSGDVYAPEASLVLNYLASRTEPYVFDGFSRIAFRVPDVDGLVEKIRGAGHKILDEPRTIEVEGAQIRLAFVEDPNGARLELIETRPIPAPSGE